MRMEPPMSAPRPNGDPPENDTATPRSTLFPYTTLSDLGVAVSFLRLTPRGTCRPRPLTARSSRISSSTASCRMPLSRGGKRSEQRQFAPDDAHRVREGEAVGVLIGFQGRFVHQPAHGEMRQQ